MKDEKTITCAVVDDDPEAIQLLTMLIETEPRLSLVFTETDSLRAIKFLRQKPVDLLFLDGKMPGIDGLDMAKALIPKPALILTTGYDRLAMQAYEIGMADCIQKPVDLERFTRAVHRAVGDRWDVTPPKEEVNYIIVKELDNSSFVKVYFDDILCLESQENLIKIHLPLQQICTRQPLKDIENRLPGDLFIRVHKSYIVAKYKVDKFNKKQDKICIQGRKEPIPLGRMYAKGFKAQFFAHHNSDLLD